MIQIRVQFLHRIACLMGKVKKVALKAQIKIFTISKAHIYQVCILFSTYILCCAGLIKLIIHILPHFLLANTMLYAYWRRCKSLYPTLLSKIQEKWLPEISAMSILINYLWRNLLVFAAIDVTYLYTIPTFIKPNFLTKVNTKTKTCALWVKGLQMVRKSVRLAIGL